MIKLEFARPQKSWWDTIDHDKLRPSKRSAIRPRAHSKRSEESNVAVAGSRTTIHSTPRPATPPRLSHNPRRRALRLQLLAPSRRWLLLLHRPLRPFELPGRKLHAQNRSTRGPRKRTKR